MHTTSRLLAATAAEAAALADAGVPAAFVHLDGTLAETVVLGAPAGAQPEVPRVVPAEITDYTTEYVFDPCDLLDQAAAAQPGT